MWYKIGYNTLLGLSAIISVSFLWNKPLLLTLLLLSIGFVALYLRNEKRLVKLYLFASLFGAVSEAIAIYFGAWSYSLPQFVGIPLWLIPLWGIAAIFLDGVTEH